MHSSKARGMNKGRVAIYCSNLNVNMDAFRYMEVIGFCQ